MRRDQETSNSDNIQLIFDTYHNHIGRTIFIVAPSGSRQDAGQANGGLDGNGVIGFRVVHAEDIRTDERQRRHAGRRGLRGEDGERDGGTTVLARLRQLGAESAQAHRAVLGLDHDAL